MSWWIESEAGLRVRIGPSGLVLGRHPRCAVVLTDPRASGVHALLLPAAEGVELRSIGRNATEIDGRAVSRGLLGVGACIELPGARFVLGRDRADTPPWTLLAGELRVAIGRGPFLVGGDRDCDLALPSGPPELIRLQVVGPALVGEAAVPLELRGAPFDAGSIEQLLDGDTVAGGPVPLSVSLDPSDRGPTRGLSPLPIRAAFTFLPTGGRLTLHLVDGHRVSLDLPELRARLVALLLAPPGELQPGELVPDEVLLPRIWPGQARTRLDLNTLVHRTRKDLLAAGVNPGPILVRPRAGHATALRLARGAEATVT